MHPVITAWLEYKKITDIQVSYENRLYPSWVGECRKRFEWFKQLELK